MQLFVTNKGFVNVIPMTKKIEVIIDLKMSSKEIGAPNAIISDAAREKISKEVRDFSFKIGTYIRFLEEGTPRDNHA